MRRSLVIACILFASIASAITGSAWQQRHNTANKALCTFGTAIVTLAAPYATTATKEQIAKNPAQYANYVAFLNKIKDATPCKVYVKVPPVPVA